MVCAGALLLVVSACVPRSFLAPPASSPRYRQLAAGSLAQVAATLETGLGEVGISVLVKRLPGEVRLVGQSKSGEIFCLYVKSVQVAGAKRTVVSVRWDRRPDDQFWATVVELLSEVGPEEGESADENR
jgi:hypothetical protein